MMCESAAISDVMHYLLTLIPLQDHASVSALSCTCRAYVMLHQHFLAVNDIIDARGLLPIKSYTTFDQTKKYHGEMTFTDSWNFWAYLRQNQVSPMGAYTGERAIFHYRYGELVNYTIPNGRVAMYKHSIADQIVNLECHSGRYPSVTIIMLPPNGRGSRYAICTFEYISGRWQHVKTSTRAGADILHHPDELAVRILAEDLRVILAPFFAITLSR
jgi:hypothetical protein